jgi:hypothetical protein
MKYPLPGDPSVTNEYIAFHQNAEKVPYHEAMSFALSRLPLHFGGPVSVDPLSIPAGSRQQYCVYSRVWTILVAECYRTRTIFV